MLHQLTSGQQSLSKRVTRASNRSLSSSHQGQVSLLISSSGQGGPSPTGNLPSRKRALVGIENKNQKNKKKKMDESIPTLARLPAEMWSEIFGKVQDPLDWLNCSNTCTFFQDLMEKDKVTTLLPSVLKIVEKHQQYSPCPPKFKLTSEELLNFRLVSKSWRSLVDRHVSNHPSTQDTIHYHDISRENHEDHFANALPITLDLDDTPKILEVLNFWNQCKQNNRPLVLPSRHLIIKNLPFEEDCACCGIGKHNHPLLELLDKLGPTIWHFAVTSSGQEFTENEEMVAWYKAVVQCLQRLPNLRSLYIEQPNFTADVEVPDEEIQSIFRVPHYPDLKVFQCDWLSSEAVKTFARSNGHIQKFSMNFCGDFMGGSVLQQLAGELQQDLQNVEDFSFSCPVEELGDINNLSFITLPLKKLSILGDQAISAQVLFRAVQQFGGTLTHLYVENLKRPRNAVVRINGHFPKLQCLELGLAGRSRKNIEVNFRYRPVSLKCVKVKVLQ